LIGLFFCIVVVSAIVLWRIKVFIRHVTRRRTSDIRARLRINHGEPPGVQLTRRGVTDCLVELRVAGSGQASCNELAPSISLAAHDSSL